MLLQYFKSRYTVCLWYHVLYLKVSSSLCIASFVRNTWWSSKSLAFQFQTDHTGHGSTFPATWLVFFLHCTQEHSLPVLQWADLCWTAPNAQLTSHSEHQCTALSQCPVDTSLCSLHPTSQSILCSWEKRSCDRLKKKKGIYK